MAYGVPHSVKIFLEVIGTLVAGLAIILALAVWRLSVGPISLDFLTPYIEGALTASDGSYRVVLDQTVLLWSGWSRPLDLRARGVHVLDPRSEPLANLPEVAIRVSALALTRGVIAPTSLEVIGARVHLRRRADGQLDFKFSDETRGQNEVGVVPALMADLLAPTEPQHPLSYLRKVSVTNAEMSVDDPRWDTSWKAHLDRLTFSRDAAGIRASSSLQLYAGQIVSHVSASGLYSVATGLMNLDLSFDGLRPALFAHAAPELAPLAGVSLPFRGQFALRIDLKGRIDKLHFDVSSGSGNLAMPDLYPSEIPVQRMIVRGDVDEDGKRLTLDQALLDLGGPTIGATGTATVLDGATQFTLEVTGHAIKVDRLPQLWPAKIAPNPRAWIAENLSGGSVEEMRASIAAHGSGSDLSGLALDKLAGAMTLSDIDVHYLGKMPKVNGVSGEAQFDDKSFTINVSKGSVEELSVDGGTIAITGLDGDDHRIAIDLGVTGSLRGALRLIDHEPLGYVTALGLDPNKGEGAVSARLNLKFPLLHDLRFAQVEITASADTKDASITDALFGMDLHNGNLALQINKERMIVTGTCEIGPVPVKLSWSERFGQKPERNIHLAGELADAARRVFHLDDAGSLAGPLPFELDLRATDRKSSRVDVAFDLAKSTMTLPYVDWRKQSGIPGTARLSLIITDGVLEAISDIEVEAADFMAKGNAKFDPGTGNFQTLTLDHVAFGSNDFAAVVTRGPDGTYEIKVDGQTIDASPLFSATKTGAAKEESKPIATNKRGPKVVVAITTAKLWLSKRRNQPLTEANATVDYDGERVTRVLANARTKDGSPLYVQLLPSKNGRELLISSNDAGQVFRSLDFTDDIVGGKLKVTGNYDDSVPESPFKGTARIDDYQLLNAPLLAKVLTLASLSGIVDRLNGEGIAFSSLFVSFTKTGDHFEMQDGRTAGSEFGLTFEGAFDLDTNTAKVNGTIVPIYTLNSLLGNIPLLGKILVGPKGGGFFAATYQVTGKIDNPDVSVNPLSALAPGILREFLDIFSGGGGSGDQSDSQKAKDR